MRQLSLIRHAKSSWKDANLSDFERPLNKRGLHNAPLMGKIMKQRGECFDLMVASPALRAATTAELIAAQIDYPPADIVKQERLYDASLEDLLDVIHQLPDHASRVALIAHNPGLTELCEYLSDADIANMPTGAVAMIQFDLDNWQAVYQGTGTLASFEYPRKYTD